MQSGMDQDLIFIIELGFKITYDDLTKLLPKHCRPLGTLLTIINSCLIAVMIIMFCLYWDNSH